MGIETINIPIREVISKGDIDSRIEAHNNLPAPHTKATSIGGKAFGLNDGDLAVLPTATQGQILRRGVHAWESGDLPPAGDFERITDIKIITPLTSVHIDGLDINMHGNYILFLEMAHELNAPVNYYLRINEDHTHANYRRQYGRFASTTVQSSREWGSEILRAVMGNRRGFCYARMGLVNNRFFCLAEASFGSPDSTELYFIDIRHIFSQTNITSIRISSNHTGGIGNGSRIRLFRL